MGSFLGHDRGQADFAGRVGVKPGLARLPIVRETVEVKGVVLGKVDLETESFEMNSRFVEHFLVLTSSKTSRASSLAFRT